jgi:hypothetical protein
MVRPQRNASDEFERLDRARRLLELPEVVSFSDIQQAYHQQSRRWHPDQHQDLSADDCKQHMQELNEAYRALRRYFLLCPLSLRREDIKGTPNADEWWWERFGTVFGQRSDDGG